jgi:hypothetical protein
MRFVNDVDFVLIVTRGGVHRAFAKFAGVVDAAVRGRVDFDDIETRGSTPDPSTGGALAAGLAVEGWVAATLTVERHGEDASEGGFADAARAAKEVAVSNASARDRALERRGHVGLNGHVCEPLGTVFTSECESHRKNLPFR